MKPEGILLTPIFGLILGAELSTDFPQAAQLLATVALAALWLLADSLDRGFRGRFP